MWRTHELLRWERHYRNAVITVTNINHGDNRKKKPVEITVTKLKLYFRKLSASQAVQSEVVRLLVSDEFERMWKEAVLALRQLPESAEDSHREPAFQSTFQPSLEGYRYGSLLRCAQMRSNAKVRARRVDTVCTPVQFFNLQSCFIINPFHAECQPTTVTARSQAWTVFARSNTGIMGSNPTQGMDVCLRLFCVCVVLCG
jgi:hypothetical protein